MKIKQAMRYQLYAFVRQAVIYYAAVLGIFLIVTIIAAILGDRSAIMGGGDFSTSIFLLIVGMNAFKSHLQLFVQNGLSRRTLFTGFILSALLLSFGAMVVDSLYPYLFPLLQRSSMVHTMYRLDNSFGNTLIASLWTALFYFGAMCTGFFITVLYYRMNKLLKVLVSAGVPILFFIVIPIVEVMVPSFHFYTVLLRFIGWCLGLNYDNLLGGLNKVRPLLSFAVFSTALSGLSFLLLRRATFKEA